MTHHPKGLNQGPLLFVSASPNMGRIAQPINELIERRADSIWLTEGSEDSSHGLVTRTLRSPLCPADRLPECGKRCCRYRHYREGYGHGTGLSSRAGARPADRQGNLVVAVPEESRIETVADLAGAKVATEFPGITRSLFAEHGIDVTIVTVGGSCEATPHLRIADAIVDPSPSFRDDASTKHLRVSEEILTSTTILDCKPHIACRKEGEDRRDRSYRERQAKGRVIWMTNVHRSALADVREVLPGLSGPYGDGRRIRREPGRSSRHKEEWVYRRSTS